MVGPVEQVGTTAGAPGAARRPRAGQSVEGDFAAVLRQASVEGPQSAALLSPAPPVDLTVTLERMQRAATHLQRARAYFQPLVTTPPQIEAEA